MSDWSSKNPYLGVMSEKPLLTSTASTKETRHMVMQLGDSGLTYKAGDALGIIPENPQELVEDLLGLLGFSGDELVETHVGEADLRNALTHKFEVHRLCKKFINGLGHKFVVSGPEVTVRLVGRTRTSLSTG